MHKSLGTLAAILFTGFICTVFAAVRPLWIEHPKSDDSMYMYRVGQGSGATANEAKKAAFDSALAVMARELLTGVRGADAAWAKRLTFKGAEIIPGGFYQEEGPEGITCWVQVGYPLAGKRDLMEAIGAGERLNQRWEKAQAAAHAGEHQEVKRLAGTILAEAEQLTFSIVDPDEVKLLLADAHLHLNEPLEARQWYESVRQATPNRSLASRAGQAMARLPDPPRFWQMRSRFDGRKLAILSVLSEGEGYVPFFELDDILIQDCRESRLEGISLNGPVKPEDAGRSFRSRSFDAAVEAARESGAGVLLALSYEIDPAKRSGSSPDAKVKFYVVDCRSGATVYRGSFKEKAGSNDEERLASRAANIMIRKYLVPNCPAVSSE